MRRYVRQENPGIVNQLISEKQTFVLGRTLCMWQSRVEIEGYSVAYFDRIAVFEAPYR